MLEGTGHFHIEQVTGEDETVEVVVVTPADALLDWP